MWIHQIEIAKLQADAFQASLEFVYIQYTIPIAW